MALHWRNLLVILPVVSEESTREAVVQAIGASISVADVPNLFHEIVATYLLPNCDPQAKRSVAVALKLLCAKYAELLRELLLSSQSDGQVMLFQQLEVSNLLASSQAPLLCGKPTPDTASSAEKIYRKSWLHRQKLHFHRILKNSSDSRDESLAIDILGREEAFHLDQGLDADLSNCPRKSLLSSDEAASRGPFIQDTTSETWFSRIVRFLVMELINPVAERREGAALGLESIVSGLSSSLPASTAAADCASLARCLPPFLLHDIASVGTTSLVLDRVVAFHDLQLSSDDDDDGETVCALPVKTLLARLVAHSVQALADFTASATLAKIALQLAAEPNWMTAFAGLLLCKEQITHRPSDAHLFVVNVLEIFQRASCPVELTALAVQLLRRIVRSEGATPEVRQSIFKLLVALPFPSSSTDASMDPRDCLEWLSVGCLAVVCIHRPLLSPLEVNDLALRQAVANIKVSLQIVQNSSHDQMLATSVRLQDLVDALEVMAQYADRLDAENVLELAVSLVSTSEPRSLIDGKSGVYRDRLALWQLLGGHIGCLLAPWLSPERMAQVLDGISPCGDSNSPRKRKISLFGAMATALWTGWIGGTSNEARQVLTSALLLRGQHLVQALAALQTPSSEVGRGHSKPAASAPSAATANGAKKAHKRVVISFSGAAAGRSSISTAGSDKASRIEEAVYGLANVASLLLLNQVELDALPGMESLSWQQSSASTAWKTLHQVLEARKTDNWRAILEMVVSLPDEAQRQTWLSCITPWVIRLIERQVQDLPQALEVYRVLRAASRSTGQGGVMELCHQAGSSWQRIWPKGAFLGDLLQYRCDHAIREASSQKETGFLADAGDDLLSCKLSLLADCCAESMPSLSAADMSRLAEEIVRCVSLSTAQAFPEQVSRDLQVLVPHLSSPLQASLLTELGRELHHALFQVNDAHAPAVREGLASLVKQCCQVLSESLAMAAFGGWVGLAVFGIVDRQPAVRTACTQAFRSLLPFAPLAMQLHRLALSSSQPANEASKECLQATNENSLPTSLSDPLLRCLASNQSAPSLLDSQSLCDQFVVKTVQQLCALSIRSYQWQGVSWWTWLRRCGLSGMLADEMGLGKTLQALLCMAVVRLEGAFQDLSSTSLRSALQPMLVIAPAVVTHQWMGEVEKYFPASSSDLFRPILCHSLATLPQPSSVHADQLYITSLDFLRRHVSSFQAILWEVVVLDEAHLIKNSSSAAAQAVFGLRSKARLALTGTPVMNRVDDLWSILQFLLPDYLGDRESFRRAVERPIRKCLQALPSFHSASATSSSSRAVELTQEGIVRLQMLHRQVLPFFLRRTKDVVLRDLPPKTVVDVLCPLSSVQRSMYSELCRQGAFRHKSPEEHLQSMRIGGQATRGDSSRPPSEKEAEEEGKKGDEEEAVELYSSLSRMGGKAGLLSSSHSAAQTAGQTLVALTAMGLVCVHPALVLGAPHRRYRDQLVAELRSSGKMLQLLRLLCELQLVDLRDADVSSLSLGRRTTGWDLYDLLVASTESLGLERASREEGEGGREKEERAEDWVQTASTQDDSDESDASDSASVSSAPSRRGRQAPPRKKSRTSTSTPKKSPEKRTGPPSSRKVLLFVQHRNVLDLVEQFLTRFFPTMAYGRIDGSMPSSQRYAIVERFNYSSAATRSENKVEGSAWMDVVEELRTALPVVKDERDDSGSSEPELRLLLLTTRACGLGLNLTAADTVIFLEHDWNPFADLQAMDRVHRLGQQNPVTVFRLLAEATLESRVMSLQQFKQHVAHQVLSGDSDQKAQQQSEGSKPLGEALWNSFLV